MMLAWLVQFQGRMVAHDCTPVPQIQAHCLCG
jgi:hypothetical protein